MNTKNDVEVVINGKQYTLSGYESSDYLQKIAAHINDKIAEFKQEDGYMHLDSEMRNVLLAINLSDDYHKALRANDDVRRECEEIEKEMFDMKHQMISIMKTVEERQKENETLKKKLEDASHRIIRLETELAGRDTVLQKAQGTVQAVQPKAVQAGAVQAAQQPKEVQAVQQQQEIQNTAEQLVQEIDTQNHHHSRRKRK